MCLYVFQRLWNDVTQSPSLRPIAPVNLFITQWPLPLSDRWPTAAWRGSEAAPQGALHSGGGAARSGTAPLRGAKTATPPESRDLKAPRGTGLEGGWRGGGWSGDKDWSGWRRWIRTPAWWVNSVSNEAACSLHGMLCFLSFDTSANICFASKRSKKTTSWNLKMQF